MNSASFHILRVGVAITFLWIGILILRDPSGWAMIQSWAADLLPFPAEQVMIGTAILDIGVGVLLLVDVFTWIAALAGSFHLAVVLTTVGINAITIRDIGLLGGTLALLIDSLPEKYQFWREKVGLNS